MKDCGCMKQKKQVAMGKVAKAMGNRDEQGRYACGGPVKAKKPSPAKGKK